MTTSLAFLPYFNAENEKYSLNQQSLNMLFTSCQSSAWDCWPSSWHTVQPPWWGQNLSFPHGLICTALQHPSPWRVLTNLCNPPENALLPLFYREATDTQEDVAFLEGQSYVFRAHSANFYLNFEGLMHQTRSQMGTGMGMTKSSGTPVAPHQSSIAQAGKESLSLGPRSAARDCFPLLPMPASITTCLPTSAVSKERVEHSFRAKGNEWKGPGRLAIPKNINKSIVWSSETQPLMLQVHTACNIFKQTPN